MAKMKITGDKIVIKQSVLFENCEKHAKDMKANAIRKAPIDTGKLKKEGIKKDTIENGTKVYLDTDAVYYGVYQELGWNQDGFHPGKFFMESAFELECAKAGIDAQQAMRKALKIEGSNGYDIVEYRRVNGKISKGAYKK